MDLEPWNLFVNDFVTGEEEEEAILSDNVRAENALPQVKHEPVDGHYATERLQANGVDDGVGDGVSDGVGDGDVYDDDGEERQNDVYITPEPLEDFYNSARVRAVRGRGSADKGEDDDTIFNFGAEPAEKQAKKAASTAATATAAAAALANGDPSAMDIDATIDYESAVVYICPACGAEFDAQDAWKRHMNSQHDYNTRRGLNFIPLDRLYHQCLECHKRIAMHAMENLLKHKFTHLPYRCTKCKICLRQYKYRQDLMVHLRMVHRDDLLTSTERPKRRARGANACAASATPLAIKDIKENAIDIFENTCDGIEVRNELIEPDDHEQSNNSFVLPDACLEDELNSRSSSRNSGDAAGGKHGRSSSDNDLCERYVQYICPKCAMEYGTQAQWRHHIERMHGYGTRRGLNFKEVNQQQHAKCLECNRVVYVNVLRNLQLHKFSHLPHKSWLRCKLCFRSFVGHKEIVKHLVSQHRLGVAATNDDDADADYGGPDDSQDADGLDGLHESDQQQPRQEDDDDSQLLLQEPEPVNENEADRQSSSRSEDRDSYEPHIEYLCPQCGKLFANKKMWRKHIVMVHRLTDLQVLNFKVINERQVMCLECDKIITNAYGVQNAQQHRITHMPFKAFVRCRICTKSYTDRKGLMKHLNAKHHIGQDDAAPAAAAGTAGGGGGGVVSSVTAHRLQTRVRPMTAPQSKSKMRMRERELKQERERARMRSRHWDWGRVREDRPKYPQREIVRHEDVIFEIKFLDEDEDADEHASTAHDDNADSEVVAADDDDDQLLMDGVVVRPEVSFRGSLKRLKCDDCGVVCRNQQALRSHVQAEHGFLGFNNSSSELVRGASQSPVAGGGGQRKRARSYSPYGRADGGASSSQKRLPQQQPRRQQQQLVQQLGKEERSTDSDELLIVPTTSRRRDDKLLRASAEPTGSIEQNFCYLCPACGVEFRSQLEWRRHINAAHHFDKRQYLSFRPLDKYRYQCTLCKDIVPNAKLKGLQDHKFRHLPFKLYIKCLICGTCYNHKPNMFSHLRVRHNLEEVRPDEMAAGGKMASLLSSLSPPPPPPSLPLPVAISAAAPSSLAAGGGGKPPGLRTVEDCISYHNAVDHDSITYRCPQCNEAFDTHVFWRKHIVEEHNLNNRQGLNFRQIDAHHYLCLQCYKRVTVTHTKGAIGQLQSHKFRHLPYKSFHCRACDGVFVRKQMFFKHLNRATNTCGGAPATQAAAASSNDTTTSSTPTASRKSKAGKGPPTNPSLHLGDLDTQAPPTSTERGTSDQLILNQTSFSLLCPKCGEEFDTWRPWRQHLNVVHAFDQRETLNFKQISASLHQCLDCEERVAGRKLRVLQIHKFKHLPFGAYIQCKFCSVNYHYIRSMKLHLQHMHPNVVQRHEEYAKMEALQQFEGSNSASNTDADHDDDDDNNDDDEDTTSDNEVDAGADANADANVDAERFEQFLLG